MKKLLAVLFLIGFFLNNLAAQIATTLNFQSQPPASLSEWSIRNSVLNFIVDYGRPDPTRVVFKTEIKQLDGTVVAVTNLQTVPSFTLNRGVTVYYSKDVMPLEYMLFSGHYNNTFVKTGKLLAGQYQICVSILQAGTFQVLASERCRIFNLISLQLPFLMMPENGMTFSQLQAQNAITFRWTPMVPQSAIAPTKYRLQVFEILNQQQSVQALRANQPILDILLRGVTQYIWQPRMIFSANDSLSRFIWTIQTLDANDSPVLLSDGNGESRSNPFTFTIRMVKKSSN